METLFDRFTIAQGGTIVANVVGAFAIWDRWKKRAAERRFRNFCAYARGKLTVPVALATGGAEKARS